LKKDIKIENMAPEEQQAHHVNIQVNSLAVEEEDIVEQHEQHNAKDLVTIRNKKPIVSHKVDRCVRFESFVDIYDTIGLDSYSKEEWEAVWYTVEELCKYRQERQEECQLIENDKLVEDETHTARGLETLEERRNREELTHQALDCVLDEQDTQFDEGIDNQEVICMLYEYFCLTHNSSQIACQRAARDHEECRRYYSTRH
jgi:hypothetical protein